MAAVLTISGLWLLLTMLVGVARLARTRSSARASGGFGSSRRLATPGESLARAHLRSRRSARTN
jgi:hypothetical protein